MKPGWMMWIGCGLVFSVIGCGPQSATAPANKAGSQAGPPAMTQESPTDPFQETSPKSAGISVMVVDDKGLEAAISKHAGKVVLVDCWATWCVPCVKAFPHTLELGRKHAEQGLVVMSLSFDDADEDSLAKVRKFLKEQQATDIENYVSSLDLAGEGAEAFAIDDGAIPHYKLYDRTGKLVRSFSAADPDQPVTDEILEEAIRELLP